MLRIVTHIECLLLVHDCVIVPKFGGFVLQNVPARKEDAEHIFYPSRKEIGFNATLQHTDGLLCESYMQKYAVSYQQAQMMLEEDVEEMKRILLHERTLAMDVLGMFSLGEEGQPVFHPGQSERFSIDSYGLPVFHFPALASLQTTEDISLSQRKKDLFYIPVSRRLLRTVTASAAAVTLFLLISTPVKDVSREAYTASFIPTEIVVAPIVEQRVHPVMPKSVFAESPVAIPVHQTETADVKQPFKQVVDKTQTIRPKTYHVVIASFPSEVQANEYLSDVDRHQYANAGMVMRSGKCRIYADKFDNREEAETYLSTLRADSQYKDAWLFICR